jgi:hypothetical protein
MQIYPMNFIYALVCMGMIPAAVYGGAYIGYYLGNEPWVSFVISLIPVILFITAVSFILSAVNVEVWDAPYLNRRL